MTNLEENNAQREELVANVELQLRDANISHEVVRSGIATEKGVNHMVKRRLRNGSGKTYILPRSSCSEKNARMNIGNIRKSILCRVSNLNM